MIKEVVITTENESILLDAKLLRIKAEFIKLGFNSFPRDLVLEECPFKTIKEGTIWMNKAGNVWRGRNRDSEIIDALERALQKIKFE